jgi:hypothetical protein
MQTSKTDSCHRMNNLETELLHLPTHYFDVFIKTMKMGDIQIDKPPHTDILPVKK